MELRALEKGYEEREHREWERARYVAHLNYLCQPVWGKGRQKERDPRKFSPFPWDELTEAEKSPKIIKVRKSDIKKLNAIFSTINEPVR